MTLGRDALRQYREQQANQATRAAARTGPSPFDPLPAHRQQQDGGTPMDRVPIPDATICVWNGVEWLTYDEWLASAPVIREESRQNASLAVPKDATCVAGECGGTKVWLVKDGERWLMFVGSRRPGARRRDFASPYLEHAIRTAEHWYGAAGGGWREEKGRDAGARQAADLSAQDSTVEKGAGERGHDDLDLGGQEPGR